MKCELLPQVLLRVALLHFVISRPFSFNTLSVLGLCRPAFAPFLFRLSLPVSVICTHIVVLWRIEIFIVIWSRLAPARFVGVYCLLSEEQVQAGTYLLAFLYVVFEGSVGFLCPFRGVCLSTFGQRLVCSIRGLLCEAED